MSVLEWKKFNFFRLISADHNKLKNTIKTKISSCACTSAHKVFCDVSGYVHVFFRSWDSISFSAYNTAVRLCSVASEKNWLFTLAEDNCRNEVLLKVWDLSNITKRYGATCIGTAAIQSNNKATALNISYQNSNFIVAVGFDRGYISVFKGIIIRDFSSGFRRSQISINSITGIEFKKSTNYKCVDMFVSSDAGVFCYSLNESHDEKEIKIVLDSRNEPTRCCALQCCESIDSYFIVGRDDAIYCYTSDGRGPCYAIDGQKEQIAWFSNYLVVLIHQTNSHGYKKTFLLIIVDIINQLIVYNKTMESVSRILVDNQTCYVLTDTNDIYQVYEKDINSKLELLINKHLYDVALRLINLGNFDDGRRTNIYKLYGDHLYSKGDYSGAIRKYIRTIGVLEPYCIIRKYLDSKLVYNLSEYLDALLKTDFATEKHIQLYMNCTSRIHLSPKIDEILTDNGTEKKSFKDIFCNMNESIIKNSCLEQNTNNSYTRIIDTRLSTLLSIIDIIEKIEIFFCRFEEHQIYNFFKEHGSTLIKHYTLQTTETLKLVCINDNEKYDRNFKIKHPEYFIPLFIEHQFYCKIFLEHIIVIYPDCSEIVYNYLFELYIREWKSKSVDSLRLIRFLKTYNDKFTDNHILILCKIFQFREGLLYFYKKKQLHNLSIRNCMHNNDFTNIYYFYETYLCDNPKLWIHALNEIKLNSKESIAFINYIFKENYKKHIHSPLQILRSVTEIKKILVSHVKELYFHASLKYSKNLEQKSKNIENIKNKLKEQKDLCHNFIVKPIEFRNIECDICKKQLNHPAVYFMCQHTFHISCSENEKMCIICESKHKSSEWFYDQTNDNKTDFPQLHQSKYFILLIAMVLKKGIIKEIFLNKECKNKLMINELSKQNNIKMISRLAESNPQRNPFECDIEINVEETRSKYDANLNPFE